MLLLACAAAAQTPADAARDLARRIAGVVPKETVSLAVRNLSSLAPAQVEEARRGVEAELRAQGVRVVESGGVAVRITASDSMRERLLVAEVPRGEERQVVMSAWPREAEGARALAGAAGKEAGVGAGGSDPRFRGARRRAAGARTGARGGLRAAQRRMGAAAFAGGGRARAVAAGLARTAGGAARNVSGLSARRHVPRRARAGALHRLHAGRDALAALLGGARSRRAPPSGPAAISSKAR